MRVVILGAAGFIGTNLAKNLLEIDSPSKIDELVLVDEKVEYFRNNPVAKDVRAKIEICLFNKDTNYNYYIEKGDIVFHLVSTNNPTTSNCHISDDMTNNVAISVNILEACIKKKAGRIIFISSGGTVYGISKCPIKEDAETNPINTYGIQKLAIEKLVYLYNYLYGLDYRIVRLSNPYGPYQRPNGKLGVVTTFTYRALKKIPIEVYGDGTVIRDYIYIDDAISALINISFKECKNRIYNVGSGRGVSINEIISYIEKATSTKMAISYLQERLVDLRENYLDVSRYMMEFGDITQTPLEQGIENIVRFIEDSKL